MDPQTPDRIGPYRILGLLGRGGQGVVYRALDDRLGREVALKVLDELSTEGLARLQREARVTSRLDHPGLCTIFESGRDGDRAFLAMRLVDGESLAEQLRLDSSGDLARAPRIPLPPGGDSSRHTPRSESQDRLDRLLRWFAEAAHALHAAHEVGLLHRDVKPGNLMIDRNGSAVVLDFGLARDQHQLGAGLTAASALLGTPEYMAPEQIDRRQDSPEPDARADVWGLGVCLFESLARELPFEGASWSQLTRRILEAPVPNPRRRNRLVSADLRAVVEAALEKDPDRRYRSARELAEDLERVRTGQTVHARRTGPAGRLVRWARRNVRQLSAATLVILLVVLLVATGQRARDNRRAEAAQVAARAALLVQAGDWDGALQAVASARALGFEDRIALCLQETAALVAKGDLDAARIALAESGTAPDPQQRAELMLWRGELAWRPGGDPEAGHDEVRAAIASGALLPADQAYAEALVAESLQEARAASGRALRFDPRHHRARELHGLLLTHVGHPDEARTFGQSMLEADPRDPVAITALVLAAQRGGGAEAARTELSRIAARLGTDADARLETAIRQLELFLETEGVFGGLEQALLKELSDPRRAAQIGAYLERILPLVGQRILLGFEAVAKTLQRRLPLSIETRWTAVQAVLARAAQPGADPQLVVRDATRAITYRPEGTLLLIRGLAWLQAGYVDRAAEDLEAAATEDSVFPVRHLAIAVATDLHVRAWQLEAHPDSRTRSRAALERLLALLTDDLRTAALARDDATATRLQPVLRSAARAAATVGDMVIRGELADAWCHAMPGSGDAWITLAEVAADAGHWFRARDLAGNAESLGASRRRVALVRQRIAAALRAR